MARFVPHLVHLTWLAMVNWFGVPLLGLELPGASLQCSSASPAGLREILTRATAAHELRSVSLSRAVLSALVDGEGLSEKPEYF